MGEEYKCWQKRGVWLPTPIWNLIESKFPQENTEKPRDRHQQKHLMARAIFNGIKAEEGASPPDHSVFCEWLSSEFDRGRTAVEFLEVMRAIGFSNEELQPKSEVPPEGGAS